MRFIFFILVTFFLSCTEKESENSTQTSNSYKDQKTLFISHHKKADSLMQLYYNNLTNRINSIEYIRKSLGYYKSCLLNLPYKSADLNSYIVKSKMAECYMILKDYSEAITLLKEICIDIEKDKDAYFLLAQCFYNIDDKKESLNICDALINQFPLFIEPLLLSGNIYAEDYDDKALKYYELALQIDSLSIKALYGKGLFYQNNMRYSEAVDVYHKIKEIDQLNINATFNLGFIFMEIHDYNNAINYFSDVILTESMYYKAYFARGICYEKKGDVRAAEKDYRKSLEIYPNYQNAQQYLDRLLSNNEKYK